MPKRIFYEPGHIYFISTNTWRRRPLFRNPDNCRIVLQDFEFYRQKHHYLLFAWVIMPDHFHWLIQPSPADFARFKAIQSQREGKYSHNPHLFYLSYIMEGLKSHTAQVINNRFGGRVWQASFHDRAVRDRQGLFSVIKYIHDNPIKAGLSEAYSDYAWSSYHDMYCKDDSLLSLDELPY